MLIFHPILGERDADEFVYLGCASLLDRPKEDDKIYDYVYTRDNPAGVHRELWYHQYGDQSWLIVTRDTLTHEIIDVELANQYNKGKVPNLQPKTPLTNRVSNADNVPLSSVKKTQPKPQKAVHKSISTKAKKPSTTAKTKKTKGKKP